MLSVLCTCRLSSHVTWDDVAYISPHHTYGVPFIFSWLMHKRRRNQNRKITGDFLLGALQLHGWRFGFMLQMPLLDTQTSQLHSDPLAVKLRSHQKHLTRKNCLNRLIINFNFWIIASFTDVTSGETRRCLDVAPFTLIIYVDLLLNLRQMLLV